MVHVEESHLSGTPMQVLENGAKIPFAVMSGRESSGRTKQAGPRRVQPALGPFFSDRGSVE